MALHLWKRHNAMRMSVFIIEKQYNLSLLEKYNRDVTS